MLGRTTSTNMPGKHVPAKTSKPLSWQLQKPDRKPAYKVAQNNAQTFEHKDAQVSRNLSTEEIELLAFRLRKDWKTKINTEVPEEWKKELDNLAHRLQVGKYDLLMYIVGQFLGKTQSGKDAE